MLSYFPQLFLFLDDNHPMEIGRISFPLEAYRPVELGLDTLTTMAPQVVEFVRGGQTDALQALLNGNSIPQRHHAEAVRQIVLGVSLNLVAVKPPIEIDRVNAVANSLHYSFEEGVQEMLRMIDNLLENKTDEGPVLIAVYGWPDAGKSYLMEKVKAALQQRGIICNTCGGATRDSDFQDIKQFLTLLSGRVIMFHCGWARENRNERWMVVRQHEDPNSLAGRHGLTIHANIGICNPRNHPPLGDYDLMIRNPESVEKKPVRKN